jgi:3-dehydroquinate synthase
MTDDNRIAGAVHNTAAGPDSASGTTANNIRKANENAVGLRNTPWYNEPMASFRVDTPQRTYDAIVERGAALRISEFIPARAGKIFVVSTADVWVHQGARLERALAGRDYSVLFFPGGESRKRMAEVEALAEKMMEAGGDRSSIVVAFGGGIVGDLAGFLAAIFMRGVPVIQVPTTLLAQVDAAVGGKTGANLVAGKNLVGCFHQPLAVLIDPDVLSTLPAREYRAGLFEIIKCGVIRDAELFHTLDRDQTKVFGQDPETVEHIIAASVRIKAEVVSADEREGGLRRILNFGHTVGHALEAETKYEYLLHGEAVAFGMRAATEIAQRTGDLKQSAAGDILRVVENYGPIPALDGIPAKHLAARLSRDKKTIQGKIHFVLPVRIGDVKIASDVDPALVMESIEAALGR